MKKLAALALLALAGTAIAQPAGTTYVAANWASGGLINYLGANLQNLGSFNAGNSNPNGTAFNGANNEILVGTFSPPSVRRYTAAGVFIGSFATLEGNLQGMDMAGNELAIANGSDIVFRNPVSGAFIRQINNPAGSDTEGITYRGANNAIYTLNDSGIQAINAANGAALFTIPNPAANSPFGGTALAYNGALDQIVVGDANGGWWRINPLNGAVAASGNNGVEMFGMSWIPAPSTAALLAFAGVAAARRRRA